MNRNNGRSNFLIIAAGIAIIAVVAFLYGSSQGSDSANAKTGNNPSAIQAKGDGTNTGGTKPSTKSKDKNAGGNADANSEDSSANNADDNNADAPDATMSDSEDDDEFDFVLEDGRTLGQRGSPQVDSKLGIKRDNSTGTVGKAIDITSWKVPSNEIMLVWGSSVIDNDNPKLSRDHGSMRAYLPGETANFTMKDAQYLVIPAPVVNGKANTRAAYSKYCAMMIWHVYSVPPYSMSEVINLPTDWDATCNGNIKMNGKLVLGKARERAVALK